LHITTKLWNSQHNRCQNDKANVLSDAPIQYIKTSLNTDAQSLDEFEKKFFEESIGGAKRHWAFIRSLKSPCKIAPSFKRKNNLLRYNK